MAKDDFSVIACIILSYLYDCVKNGRVANVEDLSYLNFNVNERYFNFIVKELFNAGYIDGVLLKSWKGGSCLLLTDDISITMNGISYLESNESMQKAKKVISEMKGWIESLLSFLQIVSMFK